MKTPFVTLEQLQEIVRDYPTPFHLYDEAGIRRTARDLKAAFADRFQFSLGAAGALRATDGVLHVGGSSVTLAPSFGNLAVSLAGGYLGGSEAGDVVALTFNAPYMYQNAKGDYVRTNSAEEWKAAGGAEANMRAVVACDELPQGWTVYTEHMGQYQERTAKELKRGLSGAIVLRYEGAQDKNGITERATRGRLDAATPLASVVM